MLLFDEPVNGSTRRASLDRTLMRAWPPRAARCFVSSHLLSEMAKPPTALVVIGRGKLIASTTVSDSSHIRPTPSGCAARSSTPCVRCSPTPGPGRARGGRSRAVGRGRAIEVIGDLAARNAITLHELSTRQPSLEEAYLKFTDEASNTGRGAMSALAALDAERIKLSTTRSPLWSAVGVAVLSFGLAAPQGETPMTSPLPPERPHWGWRCSGCRC